MQNIAKVLGRMYREEISSEQAEKELSSIPSSKLAEFIVDARNRGWITNFNLGLNEDGMPI